MFIIAKEITKKDIRDESAIDLKETNIIAGVTNDNNDTSNNSKIQSKKKTKKYSILPTIHPLIST